MVWLLLFEHRATEVKVSTTKYPLLNHQGRRVCAMIELMNTMNKSANIYIVLHFLVSKFV